MRIATLLACLWISVDLAGQGPTNLLVVVADDLGVDAIATYAEGTAPAPTPNLDALAARGILFRSAWAYPTCSPARAALQTGRHAVRNGVGQVGAALALDEPTLPELLDARGSGHAHAWIGKWHLAGANGDRLHPNRSGWSHFAGVLAGRVPSYTRWERIVDGVAATSTAYATTQTVDDALTWIRARTGPWVCVVAFVAPHEPFHEPPAHLHGQDLRGLDPATTPLPFYRAATEALDRELGRLLAGLGAETARTDVVFTADNGTPRNVSVAPFRGNHAKDTPYEGGVNVPLVVAGPSVSRPGREVADVVSITDLYATAVELAGVADPWPWIRIDGVSLVPYLRDTARSPLHTAVYAESFALGSDPDADGFAIARNQRYKLIRWFSPGGARDEFYDLTGDAFETRDLLLGTLTQTQRENHTALAAHIAAMRDDAGRFSGYGSSPCTGANGSPSIAGAGVPRLGATYDVILSRGPTSSAAFCTVGASDRRFAGLDLPFDLGPSGAGPGCALWASAELIAGTATDAGGAARVALTLPNVRTLVGASVFHTWLLLDAGAPNNPLGLTTSAGLAAVVGR